MIMYHKRQPEFQRNLKLENLLAELNNMLGPLEQQIVSDGQKLKYPLILVVGAPRSGTTLMMQWIASLGVMAYPTNLLSRFYGAPYIGAKIQQLFTDPAYNFNDEFFDFNSWKPNFQSNLGKTQGALEPNEFWYFWRRFIPNAHPRLLTKQELKSVNVRRMVAELAALQNVFDKPWAMKGLIMQFNIPFLAEILEKVLFIFVRRHPFYNIQSLLQAREKYFGTWDKWYSVQPPEYEELLKLSPIEQVAGQVFFTNQHILESLDQLPPPKHMVVDYERFCLAQEQVYERLVEGLSEYGHNIPQKQHTPNKFQSTNQVHFSQKNCKAIISAYKMIAGQDISP